MGICPPKRNKWWKVVPGGNLSIREKILDKSMGTPAVNNRRIAKNTLALYARMLLMMAVSFFTVRITLDALGEVDYGVYNVVGGLVAMFSVLSGAVSVAISRYLTYELGTGDRDRLNVVFCTSVNIQMLMGLLVLVVAESVGVWFLNTWMNIPAERMGAANWVFQCSVVTFVVNLVSIPYNALIIAHERMSAFAYIGLLEAGLKLAVGYLLYVSPTDRLVFYSALLMLVSALMRVIYGAYARSRFEESRYRRVKDRALMKDMSKFIGYTFWGNGVVILRDHGTNILLNIFFGPVVNAARGIAMNVNTAVYSFVSNFMTAMNPQITKSYAQSEYGAMNALILRGCRFSFFILTLLVIPVSVNIDYLLGLWLTEVPAHTAAFVVLTLVYSLVDCYVTPLCTGVVANGRIKKYEIQLTCIYVVNFAVVYLILEMGAAPEWVFILAVLFKCFVLVALLWNGRRMFRFKVGVFVRKAFAKPVSLFVACYLVARWVRFDVGDGFLRFLLSASFSLVLSAAAIWWIGMERSERKVIMNTAIGKMRRTIHKQ